MQGQSVTPTPGIERQRTWYSQTSQDPWIRAGYVLRNARQRAMLYNIPIEIDQEWIASRIRAGVCELTGIKFDLAPLQGRRNKRNPFSPSLDQIKAQEGYTLRNSRLVCSAVNLALNEFGELIFEHVARAYLKKLAGES